MLYFQRCRVKPAWHDSAWSRLAEIRSPLAFTADESFQMSRSWISWASLGLIGGALTPFMSWPAHPLSHVGWTHPDQVDRIHGYSPMDQFTLLQLLMWLMLDHLVWFCKYPEKSGERVCLEKGACWDRWDRPSLCGAYCLPRGESLWLHAGKYDRLLIGRGSKATVTQREFRSVPHLVLVLWSNLKPPQLPQLPLALTNFFFVIYFILSTTLINWV